MNTIIFSDALKGLRALNSGSVDTCITSPPYYVLRDYGNSGQIGLESTPEEYIQRLVAVFREVHRVLKPEGTVRNSCSTMHTIAEKEFTLDDFSWEHLFTRDFQTYGIYDNDDQQTVYLQASALEVLNTVIQALNAYRRAYLVSQKANKALWWQMIQLLPQSYNQRATVQMNYEVLANMYHSRKNHKLDEWRKFCEWVGGLPYSVIITGNSDNA